jgi:hypothetical protein
MIVMRGGSTIKGPTTILGCLEYTSLSLMVNILGYGKKNVRNIFLDVWSSSGVMGAICHFAFS